MTARNTYSHINKYNDTPAMARRRTSQSSSQRALMLRALVEQTLARSQGTGRWQRVAAALSFLLAAAVVSSLVLTEGLQSSSPGGVSLLLFGGMVVGGVFAGSAVHSTALGPRAVLAVSWTGCVALFLLLEAGLVLLLSGVRGERRAVALHDAEPIFALFRLFCGFGVGSCSASLTELASSFAPAARGRGARRRRRWTEWVLGALCPPFLFLSFFLSFFLSLSLSFSRLTPDYLSLPSARAAPTPGSGSWLRRRGGGLPAPWPRRSRLSS